MQSYDNSEGRCPLPSAFVRFVPDLSGFFLQMSKKSCTFAEEKKTLQKLKWKLKKHAGFTPYLTPIFTPSKQLKLFIPVKSFYKYELANAAGVSDRTFRRWLSENTEPLSRLGVKPTTKMLPPRAVEWICREYGIDCPIA